MDTVHHNDQRSIPTFNARTSAVACIPGIGLRDSLTLGCQRVSDVAMPVKKVTCIFFGAILSLRDINV